MRAITSLHFSYKYDPRGVSVTPDLQITAGAGGTLSFQLDLHGLHDVSLTRL